MANRLSLEWHPCGEALHHLHVALRWVKWERLDQSQSFRYQYRAVPVQVCGRESVAPPRAIPHPVK